MIANNCGLRKMEKKVRCIISTESKPKRNRANPTCSKTLNNLQSVLETHRWHKNQNPTDLVNFKIFDNTDYKILYNIIVVMQKSKQRQEKTQLFSFSNSFKNSCVATPESSKYLSIDTVMRHFTIFFQLLSNPTKVTRSASLNQLLPSC